MNDIEKEYYRRLALQQEYGGTDKPINKIEPLVSVVTTTYQHAPYIRQCLDSILMQETDFPFELIIGEDGSTDGTREICIEYADRYPDKIRLFLRDRNLTQYYTSDGRVIRFNGHFARAAARGKYIALCEGDDYWIDKTKLQKQVEFLVQNKNYILVGNNVNIINEKNEIIGKFSKRKYNQKMTRIRLLRKWSIPTCSIFYRKFAYQPERYFKIYNFDFILQNIIAKYGNVFLMKDVLCCYRRHSTGMTAEYINKPKEVILNKIQALNVLRRNDSVIMFPVYMFVLVYEYIKLIYVLFRLTKLKKYFDYILSRV